MTAALPMREAIFFAENTLITIQPLFTLNEQRLQIFSGSIGPFVANVQVEVPLWLAVMLKRQKQCKIICPVWMLKENLQDIKSKEKEGPIGQLEKMPTHFIEIASILLSNCGDDIEDENEIRLLIEDIEDLRQQKLKVGLKKMAFQQVEDDQPIHFWKSINASHIEINAIKPLLLSTLNEFYSLYRKKSNAISSNLEYQKILLNQDEHDEYQQLGQTVDHSISRYDEARFETNQEDSISRHRAFHDSQNSFESDDDDVSNLATVSNRDLRA